MKKNLGLTDRVIRIVGGLLVGLLYWQEVISGGVAIALGIVAAIFIITGFVSFCPIYSIFGWKSIKAKWAAKE